MISGSENQIASDYADRNKDDIDPNEQNPTQPIIKLYYMCQDIYGNDGYPLFFRQMMNNITRDYTDKFTFMDKIILLILGVEKINSFRVLKEVLPTSRFDPKTLSSEEKVCTELETTVVYLTTNIGNIVIGYDYAYVIKKKETPTIETKSEEQLAFEKEQDAVDYDLDYPVITIDNINDVFTIHKRGNDKTFSLAYKECIFRSVFMSEKFDTSDMEVFNDKHLDQLQSIVTNMKFVRSLKNDKVIVYEFSDEDGITVQHVYYYESMSNNYDIIYPSGETVRTYFVCRAGDGVD